MQLYYYTCYNKWANDLLLSVIESELSEESLDKEITTSFPSLRKTVYHIWDAEFIWLKRLNGEPFSTTPGKEFKGAFSIVRKNILSLDDEIIDYVSGLDEQRLNSFFSYKNIEGKLFTNKIWQSIHHCMNHSTYHRGQVVTIIRQLGIVDVPSTDFISFCRIPVSN
jgi:uncharacterized damage-inducible protein DinB